MGNEQRRDWRYYFRTMRWWLGTLYVRAYRFLTRHQRERDIRDFMRRYPGADRWTAELLAGHPGYRSQKRR